jgi:hypothetical protein
MEGKGEEEDTGYPAERMSDIRLIGTNQSNHSTAKLTQGPEDDLWIRIITITPINLLLKTHFPP